jgi:hypothetical protein
MVRRDLTLSGHVKKIVSTIKERCVAEWDARTLLDPRSELLAFFKHHVSLAMVREHP